MFSSPNTRSFNRAKDNGDYQWDVVFGGGIIGAGILREACRNGLSALLIE
ncbi:MAG: glycerol-3-phosphate dehydrogenase [Paraglaciecola sp.]